MRETSLRARFTEEPLIFKGARDLELIGTICRPAGRIRGVILMLGGSGIVDQDETMPAFVTYSRKVERPFAQIAHHLANEGFMTFRYNKRGIVPSRVKAHIDRKVWEGAGRKALVKDAVCAARMLMKLFSLREQDLIILGHSEGTIIGTEVALAIGGSRKLVLLGAVSRSLLEIAFYQNVDIKLDENPKLKRFKLEQDLKRALKPIMKKTTGLGPDRKPNLWLNESFRAKPNRIRLAKTTCPVGIFQGELDRSTPIEEALEIKRHLGRRATLFSYPGLGHLFSRPKKGRQTLGPVARKVLEDIAKFCRRSGAR